MKKVWLLIILLIPVNCLALEIPNINSKYAIVYDLTSKEIIYEKDSDVKTSIASLTKILTVATALDKIDDLDRQVLITNDMLKDIYWNASVAGLKVGDIVTYQDLIYATILPSGADAAQVLAISLGGSVDNFIKEMNVMAKKIGMNDSNFVNTSGLDSNLQYSTARDTLKLILYALDNPKFREVFTTKSYILSNGLKVEATIMGYQNKLNIDTGRILGSKTGTTDEAGLCLAALFNVLDHDMVSITLKADLDQNYYNLKDTLNIIQFLDNNYTVSIPEDNKPSIIIDTNNKKEESYSKSLDYKIYAPFILLIILLVLFIPFKRLKNKK